MKNFENLDNQIHEKMNEKLGIPNLDEILAEKPLRDLNPIFIKAFRERAANRNPNEILQDYESKNEFYGVSSIDQRKLIKLESTFYEILPEKFHAVEVSPISPLGLNSVITKVSQDISLSTIRGSEVISDPTTSLVLECAMRRKKQLVNENTRMELVNLATAQRVLRLQPFDKDKGYMQHFTLFGLCTGGRDKGEASFVVDSTIEHISIWLDLIKHLKNSGYAFDNISVNISDIRVLEKLITTLSLPREEINKNSFNEDFDFFKEYNIRIPKEIFSMQEIKTELFEQYGLGDKIAYLSALEQRVIQPLREKYPDIRFCLDFARKGGLGYYQNVCFHIFASNFNGRNIPLADGGSVDWLGKLLSSNKERAFTSGFGAELVQKLFSQIKKNRYDLRKPT